MRLRTWEVRVPDQFSSVEWSIGVSVHRHVDPLALKSRLPTLARLSLTLAGWLYPGLYHTSSAIQFTIEMSSPPASDTCWVTMLTSDDFLIAAEVLIRSLRAHTDGSRTVCVLVTPTVGLRARKSLERLGACLRTVDAIPAPGDTTVPSGKAMSASCSTTAAEGVAPGHAAAAPGDATAAPREASAASRSGVSHVPGWDATGYTSTLPPLARLQVSCCRANAFAPGSLSQSCTSGT